MKSLTRALRTSTLTAAAAAALLGLAGPAALAADDADVEVTHECTSIDVTSTQAISNVVLEFADGDTQRFEGLPESRTGTFAGTGDDSGDDNGGDNGDSDDVQSDDEQTPDAQVLSAGLERDDDSGMRAADANDVRGDQQLPNAGADTPAGLAAALAALALGGVLLRRTSRSSA